jgi:hypothetical protein
VHKIQHRTEKQKTTEVRWIGGTSGTLGEVQNVMENDTLRGMASSLHTYSRGHTNELVYKPGTAQRNYDLDIITTKFNGHFLIRA